MTDKPESDQHSEPQTPLLPCPFCGSTNVEAIDSLDFVSCQDCGASLEDAEPSSRKLWNTRAANPSPSDIRQEDVRELFKREDRGAGYWFVTAPGFPGWSHMLTPVCPEAREKEMRLSFVAFLEAETRAEPVAWRWRHADSKHWIYDPSPEWREDFKDDPAVVFEPLYASPPPQPDTAPSPLKLGSSEPLGPRYDGTTMDNQQLHGTTRRNQTVVTAGETAPHFPSPLSTGEVKRGCPFCASVDGQQTYTVENWNGERVTSEVSYVECEDCGARGPECESGAKAEAIWRAALSQPPATEQIRREVIEEPVADQIIGAIEERFPNWRSYRDLIDCIDCTLHELREKHQ